MEKDAESTTWTKGQEKWRSILRPTCPVSAFNQGLSRFPRLPELSLALEMWPNFLQRSLKNSGSTHTVSIRLWSELRHHDEEQKSREDNNMHDTLHYRGAPSCKSAYAHDQR